MIPPRPETWLVRLWAPDERLPGLRARLDDEERARSDRFVFPWLQTRFIVAHAALRTVVERLTGQPAPEVRFGQGPHGKPFLRDHALELNLSHSGDWGLIAVGHDRAVGVDLETIGPDRVTPTMIKAVTSAVERQAFGAMAPEQRPIAFFRLWVRKEAVIKALGTGLSRSLHTIEVPLTPVAPPDGVVLHPGPDDAAPPSAPGGDDRWRLWDLPAPLGYLAALVVRREPGDEARAPASMGWLTLDELDPP